MEHHFHFDQSRQILLHIQSQEICGSAVVHRPLSCRCSYFFVRTREHHLEKVGVVELAILIRVEELQDKVAICLVDLHIAVVSHEIDHI